MNKILLRGMIRNIAPSHSIGDTEYEKAELIVPREDGQEDVLSLKFKKYSNFYSDGQTVSLKGNVRSYSQKLESGKSKVDIYVFTYFDLPETNAEDEEIINEFEIDGKVCKVDTLRKDKLGKESLHFILANNIFTNGGISKIDTYLPCVCFGSLAKELKDIQVSDHITIKGQLHSRTYKKYFDNGEMEIRTAQEAVITSYEM